MQRHKDKAVDGQNSLDVSSLRLQLSNPSLSRLCAKKMKSIHCFFLDQIYTIVIIKPDAVAARKVQEIKEKVSNISQ